MSTLDESDRRLRETAVDVLDRHYDPERHTTSVALRTADGAVYTGISLKAATAAADVHAEPIAVARAIIDGASSFDTVVAVQFDDRPADDGSESADERSESADGRSESAISSRETTRTRVVSPCGACRELLARQAPDVSVVVPGATGPTVEPLSELLPY